MDERDKPIETPYAQKVEDFRCRTVPRLVWSIAAVGCLLVFVDRAREFEYIGLDQVPENEISTGNAGVLETAGAEIFDRLPAYDPVGRSDDPQVLASNEKPTSETVNISRSVIDEKAMATTELGAGATGEWTDSRANNPSELVVDSDADRLPVIESIEMERSGLGQFSRGLDGRTTVAGRRE